MSATSVLGSIEKVQEFIKKNEGGVTLTSDRVTFPKGLLQFNDATAPRSSQTAVILQHANAITGDDDIRFSVEGNLGYDGTDDVPELDKPVLANVFFNLQSNSAVFGTSVELKVVAGDSAIVTAEGVRLQFFLSGSFSSMAGGSCQFTGTLELDNQARLNIVDARITEGDAEIEQTLAGLKITL